MDKKSRWRNLKNRLLLFGLLLNSLHAHGQEWELIRSINSTGKISSVSYDIQGYFYTGSLGKIKKYDRSGNLMHELELPNTNAIKLIEAQDPLKVFTFFGENQELMFQERFISNATIYSIDNFTSSYVEIAAPGVDNSFWLLELPQRKLVKYSQSTSSKLLSVPLTDKHNLDEVTYLKSYRDLILLVDPKNGILILDQFGNRLNHYQIIDASYLQVLNDQVITLTKDQVVHIGLYNNESIIIDAPSSGYNYVIRTRKYYVFFSDWQIDIYSLPR